MATLTPLAASFRAIPLPIPRELPVISACFPFRDISTSLSVRSNEYSVKFRLWAFSTKNFRLIRELLSGSRLNKGPGDGREGQAAARCQSALCDKGRALGRMVLNGAGGGKEQRAEKQGRRSEERGTRMAI